MNKRKNSQEADVEIPSLGKTKDVIGHNDNNYDTEDDDKGSDKKHNSINNNWMCALSLERLSKMVYITGILALLKYKMH